LQITINHRNGSKAGVPKSAYNQSVFRQSRCLVTPQMNSNL
jgi:hypothetical protein